MRVCSLCKLYLAIRGCSLIFELELKDCDVHESWILIDILRRRGFHPYGFPHENQCLCVFYVIDQILYIYAC
jgi:hypothetical protein